MNNEILASRLYQRAFPHGVFEGYSGRACPEIGGLITDEWIIVETKNLI